MDKTTKTIIGLVILVIILGGVYYLVSKKPVTQPTTQPPTPQQPTQVTEEPIKIGFIGPLTGDVANLGQNSKDAVAMAVEEINSTGGINGRKLEVVYEDSGCNPQKGANAVNKLINIDKVPVIIGGACSSETLAGAPMAESNKVVLFSYCASAPKISEVGDYIFRDYPSDNFQAKFLAKKIYEMGIRKLAVLYCLSDYCVGLKDTIEKEFNNLGGKIVAVEGYKQEARDLRTELTKIKSFNPEAIFFVGYTEATIVGLKQIKELDIKAKIFGADSWDDLTIWEQVGEAGEGAMFTTVAPAKPNFQEKFKSKTGKEVTICAPQAYDAVKIIAEIMRKVGTNSEAIKNALYQVKNYQGVSGVISFDSNGDLEVGNYILKVVKSGKPIELK